MKIKRFTDYSLRVLIYLALKENQPVTIKEVADCYKISKNHLMKVVQDLNAKDFIIATRGNNGGIRLSRPPEQINVGHIVRMSEGDSSLVECFGAENQCVITPSCQLKHMFAEAMERFFYCLDQYTLADFLRGTRHAELDSLLLASDTSA